MRNTELKSLTASETIRDGDAFESIGDGLCRLHLRALRDYLPLFCAIDALTQAQQRVIIAIDGNCASGKTTLAALLKSVYACNVFSMDDFFLQPHQRTPERLEAPGGNVDYERFDKEVIRPLRIGEPFSYRVYDCKVQSLTGTVDVTPHALNIVEGAYSQHPRLADAYDLKVFLRLDTAEQRRRLSNRNAALYDRFVQEWIPMENKYFEAFQIPEHCGLVFDAGSFQTAE